MSLHLVRGDITTFDRADAIVNAGNETLLGCFTPEHNCLDHQIHAKAGPQLHADCKRIMKNTTARISEAIITPGYRLPAKWIVHANGPDANRCGVRMDLLADTYRNCLELARRNGLHSIAFPTISTGLYGHPKKESAGVAVDAVHGWLEEHGSGMDVYFVAYDDEDYWAYTRALREKHPGFF